MSEIQSPPHVPSERLKPAEAKRAQDLMIERCAAQGLKMSRAEARQITDRMLAQTYPDTAKVVVPRQIGAGTHNSHIRLVLSGEVFLNLYGEADQPAAYSWRVGEGAFLGLLSAFTPLTHAYSVEAVGDVLCAALSRGAMRDLLDTAPAAMGKFSVTLAADLAMSGTEYLAKLVLMGKLYRGIHDEIETQMP
jgi:CRP-like cAMP-binding protein